VTAVFIHGNPETPAIWKPLLTELARLDSAVATNAITPQLPGFGTPAPSGFGATKEDYAAWLTTELERIVGEHGPVDLVGHDWGGGFVMRVVSKRPELVRSWACDVLGLFHPDYVWHDFAQIWQTPGAGEEYFEQNAAAPVADRIALFEAIGITRPTADEIIAATDGDAGREMARCILALYRSAAQPAMVEWGRELDPAATKPGLALVPSEDPFVRSHDYAREIAGRLGAQIAELDGLGHWWMLGDPARGAAVLHEFWANVTPTG
jgi:pimeloyl-ACP methyl ester carboxylesterase